MPGKSDPRKLRNLIPLDNTDFEFSEIVSEYHFVGAFPGLKPKVNIYIRRESDI